jgi:hypothetical protein
MFETGQAFHTIWRASASVCSASFLGSRPEFRLRTVSYHTSLDRKPFLTFPCQKTGSVEKPALMHRYRGHTAKYWPFMMAW